MFRSSADPWRSAALACASAVVPGVMTNQAGLVVRVIAARLNDQPCGANDPFSTAIWSLNHGVGNISLRGTRTVADHVKIDIDGPTRRECAQSIALLYSACDPWRISLTVVVSSGLAVAHLAPLSMNALRARPRTSRNDKGRLRYCGDARESMPRARSHRQSQ